MSITNDDIRREFLAAGFEIKAGHDDLKPYVYEAARRVIALAVAAERARWIAAVLEALPAPQAMAFIAHATRAQRNSGAATRGRRSR